MESFDCPNCGTQLPLVAARVGKLINCPACEQKIEVPRPRRNEDDDEYRLEGDTETHRVSGKGIENVALKDDEGSDDERSRPDLTWNLFLGGYLFPWTLDALGRWLWTSVCVAIPFWLACFTAGLFGGNLFGAPAAIVTGLVAFIFSLAGAGVVAAHALTILTETSAGNNRIENWPEGSEFFEWFGNLFYLFNAAIVCVILGFGLDRLLETNGLVTAVALFFLFPIFLLSELEAGSPLSPVSGAVFASLARRPLSWAAFYVETGLLLGSLMALAYHFLPQGPGAGAIVAPIVALVFAAAMMIYFRLLGRLAWFSSLETEEAIEP